MIIFGLQSKQFNTCDKYQMKFMRLICTLILFLFLPLTGFGQYQKDKPETHITPDDKDLIEQHETTGLSKEKLNIINNKRLKISYYTGADFIFSNRFGSASNIHFRTNASYPVTPRFTIEFGTVINFSRLTGIPAGFYPEYPLSVQSLNTTGITLYSGGSYYLSSRLTLSGMAFKQFSPDKYPAVNPSFINYNQEGVSFGLNYKLFENLQIGAQFNYIRNDGPFYPYRLNQPVFDNYYW